MDIRLLHRKHSFSKTSREFSVGETIGTAHSDRDVAQRVPRAEGRLRSERSHQKEGYLTLSPRGIHWYPPPDCHWLCRTSDQGGSWGTPRGRNLVSSNELPIGASKKILTYLGHQKDYSLNSTLSMYKLLLSLATLSQNCPMIAPLSSWGL